MTASTPASQRRYCVMWSGWVMVAILGQFLFQHRLNERCGIFGSVDTHGDAIDRDACGAAEIDVTQCVSRISLRLREVAIGDRRRPGSEAHALDQVGDM